MSGSRSRRFGLLVAACVPGLSGLAAAGTDLAAQTPASPPAATPAEASAQAVVVHGTVVDDRTGEPVLGAIVAREGGPERARSDDRGAFTLRLPDAGGTLVVSRIGFAPSRLALGGRTTVTVRMTRAAVTLSDVVVVGYGTQKRSDVTGAVASVSPQRLEEKSNTNIAQSLQGSTPGVSVLSATAGAEPRIQIQIRGRKSISASTAPLVVVDGIPFEGNLSEINTGDIASIDILKDASAAAIYGSRGANGVLLVTTRKGTVGKPRVSYSGYAGTQRISNLPRLMNAEEFAAFKCVRIEQPAPSGQGCDQKLTTTERNNLAAGVNTNWVDLATHTGTQRQHDLSVSGGTEDTKYFLGGSLLDVGGVAINDKFDRVSLRANLDQRVRPWLRVGTNSQLSRADRGGVAPSFNDAFFNNPLITPYAADGSLAPRPWLEDPVTGNALEGFNVVDDDITKRLFTSNYLEVTAPRVSGLSYRLNAGLELSDRQGGRYYGRNTSTGLTAQGRSIVATGTRNNWTMENLLRYTRSFGRHGLDVTALYSAQSTATTNDTLRAEGYPNDVLDYHSGQPATTSPPVLRETRDGLISQMGRLNYTFADRYLATFTVRRDESSRLRDRVGVFPSIALGWNASNESFFPWKDKVDALKLRLSYGRNGNQAVRVYSTYGQLDDFSYVNGDNSSAPGYVPGTLDNRNLGWETTVSTNGGIDLSLFKERVRATVDVYSSGTSDLLLRRRLSPVIQPDSIFQNVGKTSNRGVELSLSTVNVTRGSFSWGTDFNVSHNANRIVSLPNGNDVNSGWFIGQPVDVNYGYQFDGVWQEGDDIANSAQPTAKPGYVRIKDLNGDGKIDPLDRTFIGSLEPDYVAGLTNTVKFRGFTLSADLNSVHGVTRSNILLGTNQVQSDVRRNTLYRQYWTPEHPIDTYPSNSNNSNPLAVPFYEDASFVRLKDVTLSYDFSPAVLGRFGGETLRVFVNGRNLWTKTDWSGLDPELDEQRATPLEKVVMGGITVRF